MIKRYYKEIMLLAGLAVVLLIVCSVNFATPQIEDPSLGISGPTQQVSGYAPGISDVLNKAARLFLDRITH